MQWLFILPIQANEPAANLGSGFFSPGKYDGSLMPPEKLDCRVNRPRSFDPIQAVNRSCYRTDAEGFFGFAALQIFWNSFTKAILFYPAHYVSFDQPVFFDEWRF